MSKEVPTHARVKIDYYKELSPVKIELNSKDWDNIPPPVIIEEHNK